jgi:hypothetical protein
MDDHINNLYETDTLIWTNTQVDLLRTRKFHQLDVDNIIAELEYQVKNDKRQVAHRLIGLLAHLLKYQFQPERISNSWIHTITEHRRQIEGVLLDMPSLRSAVDDYIMTAYPKAVKDAARETHLPLSAFPTTHPFTKEQILDEDYWPAENDKAADP